jgi:hypothetical protein
MTEEGGEENWYIETDSFGGDFKVLLPQEIRSDVSYANEAHGRSVLWYYETEMGIGVISDSELEEGEYVLMDTTEVHDDGNIVMPKRLRENFSRPIYEGLRVAFVASPGMLEGEKRSVYLITESQENDLMQNRDGADALRDVIRTTPEFFANPY